MLPRVKIDFSNGALGSVSPSADCVVGLICTAAPVSSKLALATPYILFSLDDVADLGVTASADDQNAFLYKQVKAFYDQAGSGAELWLYAVPNTVKPSESVDVSADYAKDFIKQANGRLRCLAVAFAPSAGYAATIEKGLEADVMTAAHNAQALAEWATNTLYAPLFVLIEGRGYKKENIVALPDLTECGYNRVGILIGDTTPESDGAAIGLLAGRVAECPVQRHIGRVRDGALNMLKAYIDDEDASVANVETLNDKGFITFRTFTGKSGYFFADDNLATAIKDDYRSIARRRTVDKAFRICYATMLEHVCDEVPVTDEGKMVPSIAKSWETEIVTAIANAMTANGELGNDPADSNDKGVKCYIDYDQNILATSQVNVTVQVKPYGYAKYINVELGFMTTNTED